MRHIEIYINISMYIYTHTHKHTCWWCYLTISSSPVTFFFCLQSFPASRVFSNELVLCIRWPKYWSFSFSTSLRDSQESSPAPQCKSINSSVLSFLFGPTLTSRHDYWKNNSLDYTDLCWQSDVTTF